MHERSVKFIGVSYLIEVINEFVGIETFEKIKVHFFGLHIDYIIIVMQTM